MRRKTFIVVYGSLIWSMSLFAQCPNKDSLWARLIFLRDSSSSPTEQLKELLQYEAIIKTCPYRIDSTHAFLLHRIGSTYYKQGDYTKAAQYILQGIDMISLNAENSSINLRQNITFYYSLSAVYTAANKVAEKIKALDSCIAISIKLNAVDIFCLSALYKKIEYFFDIGDYHNCIEYAKMCEMLANEYSKKGAGEYAIAVGYVFSSLGWRVSALLEIKDYEAAEEILVNKINEIKKGADKNYLGTYLEQLAEVQIHNQNYDKALLYFNQAFICEKKAGHTITCKTILNNIGYHIYFKHLNDYDKTLFYYRQALAYANGKSQQPVDAFEALNELANIADVYAHKGLYDSAMYYFQLAFNQIRPGLNESTLLYSSSEEFIQNKKNHYLADMLINKGDAFKRQYEEKNQAGAIAEALRIYKITDKVLDRIKIEIAELQSKLFWRSDSRRLYEHAIEACYISGDIENSFYFFEKSRSVLLQDQLNQIAKMSSNDILTRAQIKKQILLLERERYSADSSSGKNGEIQSKLFAKTQELNRLEQTIRQNNPLYYQSFMDSSAITIEDVRKKVLNDKQVLLELFEGDSAVYSLLITPSKTYFKKIGKKDFDSTTREYINYISNQSLLNSRFGEYIKTANHLYQLIFQGSSLPAGRVIVSPYGHYFPFESLITSTNPKPVYFLNDHAVSYTYSARYLLIDFAGNTSTSAGTFLGVAPVQFSPAFSLVALKGSDVSLREIGAYFGDSKILIADDATRNNFLQQYSKYKIIQLYTHAADSSNFGEPVIHFVDSSLYLSDLIEANKPLTKLIVLSACETGNGKLYQGEGIFSFNRGFASLGIPSSITNLWAVDNKTTYELTEIFYKYLSQGMPVDIALQKAKLEFMNLSRANRMPYYWAAAIVAGRTESFISKGKNPLIDISIIVVVITGLSFFRLRKRKASN